MPVTGADGARHAEDGRTSAAGPDSGVRVGTTMGREASGRHPPRDPNPLSRSSTPWMGLAHALGHRPPRRRRRPRELLGHKELDPDADPGLAYVVVKRGNQLRVQAAAHGRGARGMRLNAISPGVISTPRRAGTPGLGGRPHPGHDRPFRCPPGRNSGRHRECRRVPGRAGLRLHHRERPLGGRRSVLRTALEHHDHGLSGLPGMDPRPK